MNLSNADAGKTYMVEAINTKDEELRSFLLSLGCYGGEYVTVVSRLKNGCIVYIKDSKYNIDNTVAATVLIK